VEETGKPKKEEGTRVPERPPTVAGPVNAPENCAAFPLKAITDLFSQELKASLRKQPSEHVQVYIPRALIEPRLASGAVRVSFAELRALTPEIFFHAEGAPAEAQVLLPLEIVLRQMMPARREDQRPPAIPVNIPSIFIKAGQPQTNGAAARGNADPWYSQRRPSYETQPEPAPAPTNGFVKPHHPLASERARRDANPAPVPGCPQSPPNPPPHGFPLPLPAVLAALPPEIRHALNGPEAQTASFVIPLNELDARMRAGKLLFKWGQLRAWCSVELSALAAPDLDIELPLAAVAPLYMAARHATEPRKQVTVDVRIPDIFSKSKRPAPSPSATPATPPSPPPAAPAPASPSPTAPRPAPSITAPAQIVERLRALEGVAGAFIATADGLLIAGDVPAANENVLAAFAPTVFAQLTKYVDMARLGAPGSIDIGLGDGAIVHVRKIGKLYLGVLMERDRPLPVPELARISATLQPLSNQAS
jgi:predicted regulator of Ras-like GTPase activity (Roadblock/LC7/MglB family)